MPAPAGPAADAVPPPVVGLAPVATTDAGSCRVDPPAPPWATAANWSASQARRVLVHWMSLSTVAWIWASAGGNERRPSPHFIKGCGEKGVHCSAAPAPAPAPPLAVGWATIDACLNMVCSAVSPGVGWGGAYGLSRSTGHLQARGPWSWAACRSCEARASTICFEHGQAPTWSRTSSFASASPFTFLKPRRGGSHPGHTSGRCAAGRRGWRPQCQ